MSKTIKGPDGEPRCAGCCTATEFFYSHDKEYPPQVYLHQKNVEEELGKRLIMNSEPHGLMVKLTGLCIFG